MAHRQAPIKPWAALRLWRPIKFGRLAAVAQNATRSIRAATMLEHYFPGRVSPETLGPLQLDEWPILLTVFLEAVEQARWFEINWGVIEESHRLMTAENSDGGQRLALFLTYIPVAMLGLGSHSKIYELPPMELLKALLHPEVDAVTTRLQIESDLLDSLQEWRDDPRNREAAWARLRQIETNPARYPEPLRFLPELARWACGNTGNPLLDNSFDPRQSGPWYRWDTDLPLIQSAWRRAVPVRDAYLRLMAWYSRDPGHLISLTHYLIGVTDDTDKLNW